MAHRKAVVLVTRWLSPLERGTLSTHAMYAHAAGPANNSESVSPPHAGPETFPGAARSSRSVVPTSASATSSGGLSIKRYDGMLLPCHTPLILPGSPRFSADAARLLACTSMPTLSLVSRLACKSATFCGAFLFQNILMTRHNACWCMTSLRGSWFATGAYKGTVPPFKWGTYDSTRTRLR